MHPICPIVHAQNIVDSEVEIVNSGGLVIDHYCYSHAMGLIVSLLCGDFYFLQPIELQVAFEIDDDFYEVHRLTKTRSDALKIIRPRTVFFGVILYLMAMAGIMILLSDILDDSIIWNRGPTYYQPALVLTATLLSIPIFLSPFISLYAQISRRCQ